MQSTKCLSALLLLFLASSAIHAQHIQFDQGNWKSQSIESQQRSIVVMENMVRVDTVYAEDMATGELQMDVQRYPLARYEYLTGYDPYPALWRRIDIQQQEISDTTFFEDFVSGEMKMLIQKLTKDIPNGAYHEFFPNGNIRVKGTLDGYNADGTLKKTGAWQEWDANGVVIKEDKYP